MRILIITYQFPPVGGVAVQRALSFAKYLPRHGHEVHLLTTRNPSAPVFDPTLLKHVPPEVTVYRSFTPELPFAVKKGLWQWITAGGAGAQGNAPPNPNSSPRRWLTGLIQRLLSPDPQVVWTPFALRAAARIIRDKKIDVVLVTAPPFSVLLIGNALKRKFPAIRLVSDFRDEWFRFFLSDLPFFDSDAIRRKAEAIERDTIQLSDLVLAVTASSLAEIQRRYCSEPAAKFALLPNGYDPDAFLDFTPRAHAGKRVIVTHAGTVYRTASPRYYLEALDGLPAEIRENIETRFVGRVAEQERDTLAAARSRVVELGFRPQPEALRLLGETDYLLLTMTNDFSLPGKLFEYLATGKPILALSPAGGEVDRLLRETGAGVCFPCDDVASLREFLTKAVRNRERGMPVAASSTEAVRRFARPQLTAELSRLLQQRLFPVEKTSSVRRVLAEALGGLGAGNPSGAQRHELAALLGYEDAGEEVAKLGAAVRLANWRYQSSSTSSANKESLLPSEPEASTVSTSRRSR